MEQQQRDLCSFDQGRCACCGAGVSSCTPTMRLSITSTTGNPVELSVTRGETVEGLRTHISHKLRMETDRIVLLHKDRQLTAGKLLDLGVTDGSKLTLVPVVEAGLICSTVRAERSMMDVLESLTEVQIRDFMSGRSPLTINLGIGAHVMYVQLQLSEQNVAELQQHQQHQDFKAGSRSELQTSLPTAARMSPPDSASTCSTTNTAGSTTSPVSDSTSQIQLNTLRARTSSNSATTSHLLSSTTAHPHQSCPPHTSHKSSPVISTHSLPPHPSSPLQAATPACSPAPTDSTSGPPSPSPASTVGEGHVNASSPAEPCKQPGAVIESFVSHSPGVFSGTFSGALAPCSQNSISHPRNGIAIILQILNDLLRAAFHHQGAPPAVPHAHCPALEPPLSLLQLTAEEQREAKGKTLVTRRTENLSKTADEESHSVRSPTQENQALHCKLKRLQFLMQQRRARRRTRRNSHLSQTSQPYQHPHHRP